MTSTTTAVTNPGVNYETSETQKQPQWEWRRKQLQGDPAHGVGSVLSATLPHEGAGQIWHGDVAGAQQSGRVAVWRSQAVRNALRNLDSQTGERFAVPADRVKGMRKWEGRVLDVDKESFSVELTSLDRDDPQVIADFAKEDLLPEDSDLEAGDVVYVTSRTVWGPIGPSRTSTIRLRRLGKWTEDDIADQAHRAKERKLRLASHIE